MLLAGYPAQSAVSTPTPEVTPLKASGNQYAFSPRVAPMVAPIHVTLLLGLPVTRRVPLLVCPCPVLHAGPMRRMQFMRHMLELLP